jgi:hypothetical protein
LSGKGKEIMTNQRLRIPEIDEIPPELELRPEEVEALAEELMDFHEPFADLYYRVEQAHWSYKYLQGLMLPIERKSIQPMALALEGDAAVHRSGAVGR